MDFSKYQLLERAYPDLLQDIASIIQKEKLSDSEKEIIIKAKELCQLKVWELWDNQDNEDFTEFCSIYFDIAILLENEIKNDHDIYEIIKIISLGYLGDRPNLLKNFLISQKDKFDNIEIPEKWNSRLLRKCFKAIVLLIMGSPQEAIDLLRQLRSEQRQFEKKYIMENITENRPGGFYEITSLYHFAVAIEIIALFILHDKAEDIRIDVEQKLKYHFRFAKKFAYVSDNIMLELLYDYVEAVGAKAIRLNFDQDISDIRIASLEEVKDHKVVILEE